MKKTSTPKAFNIYFDTFEHIEMLTMEQRGELFTALYEYAINEKTTEFDNGMVKMAFSFMKAQIARDFEKYREKCETMRENAKKRCAVTDDSAKASNCYQKLNKKAKASKCSQEEEKEKEKYKEEEKEKEKKENKDNKKEKEREQKEDFKNSSLSDSLSSLIDYDSVMYSFNHNCVYLSKIDKMTDSRKKAVDNAAKILGNITFNELFTRVQDSDFLSGKNGKWYGCNFDWILKPENLKKILSGAYDNPAPKPVTKPAPKPNPAPRSTSYDINELKKIDTLDFMDDDDWEQQAFNSGCGDDGAETGWNVPF